MKKTIIIDTNTLMSISQFNINLFEQIRRISDFKHELKVLDKTIKELEKIKREQTGSDQRSAKLALDIIKEKNKKGEIGIIETNTKKYVDDILVQKSKEDDTLVVTQDKELKDRLDKPLITMKKKDHLVIIK